MLHNVSLFQGLPKSDLDALSRQAVTRQFRRQTVVIGQGDLSDALYLVVTGRLKVYRSDEEGKEVILAFLEPGDSFGELALLDKEPRSASVETLEPSKLAVISHNDFYAFLANHTQVAFNLIKTLATRNRVLLESVSDLALLDVYGRVARALLKEAKPENGMLVTGKLTHQEIANMVGSSREMVSKIMKELKFGGYISVDGKRITILNRLPTRW